MLTSMQQIGNDENGGIAYRAMSSPKFSSFLVRNLIKVLVLHNLLQLQRQRIEIVVYLPGALLDFPKLIGVV